MLDLSTIAPAGLQQLLAEHCIVRDFWLVSHYSGGSELILLAPCGRGFA